MAISRAAPAAVAGNTILASSWEAEFNNIIDNALALVSPWTGNMAAGGFRLTGLGLGAVGDPSVQFTGDTNTGFYSSAADTFDIATGGVRAASFGASALIAAAPEDARTATVDVATVIRSTTSGTPAANIGVGLQFDAESADENPSTFGRIDFVATDVTAGSEDTVMDILLRVAGAAEEIKYRFASTAGAGFQGTFTHGVTADRTWTLPDSDGTLGFNRTLVLDATNFSVSDSTTETTLFTFSIPENTLSTNRRLRLVLQCRGTDPGAAFSRTFRLKYGSTTVATSAIAGPGDASSNNAIIVEAYLSGDTATNAQVGHLRTTQDVGTLVDIGRGTAAEDSTTALNLVVTVQHSVATATSNTFAEHAALEILIA